MKKVKEIKDKILKKLEGESVLRCPFCHHTKFIRKEFCEVEIIKDSDGLKDEVTDVYLDEYEYRCKKCDEEVLVEDMV